MSDLSKHLSAQHGENKPCVCEVWVWVYMPVAMFVQGEKTP